MIDDCKKKNFRIGIFCIDEERWLDVGEWDEYKKTLAKLHL